MKTTLLTLAFLTAFAISCPAQSGELPAGDRPAQFVLHDRALSLVEFREWFHQAYLEEFRLYKKQHKQTYKYRKGDFQSVRVTFTIDTLGKARIDRTQPEDLSPVQTEVLQATFENCPSWIPAFQAGRKVKMKYTMPVSEN